MQNADPAGAGSAFCIQSAGRGRGRGAGSGVGCERGVRGAAGRGGGLLRAAVRGDRPAARAAGGVGAAGRPRRPGAVRDVLCGRLRRSRRGGQAAVGVLRTARLGRRRGAGARARRAGGQLDTDHPGRQARRHRLHDGRLRRRLPRGRCSAGGRRRHAVALPRARCAVLGDPHRGGRRARCLRAGPDVQPGGCRGAARRLGGPLRRADRCGRGRRAQRRRRAPRRRRRGRGRDRRARAGPLHAERPGPRSGARRAGRRAGRSGGPVRGSLRRGRTGRVALGAAGRTGPSALRAAAEALRDELAAARDGS